MITKLGVTWFWKDSREIKQYLKVAETAGPAIVLLLTNTGQPPDKKRTLYVNK